LWLALFLLRLSPLKKSKSNYTTSHFVPIAKLTLQALLQRHSQLLASLTWLMFSLYHTEMPMNLKVETPGLLLANTVLMNVSTMNLKLVQSSMSLTH